MIAEKEKADVLWQSRFWGTAHHVHLAAQSLGRKLPRLFRQIAVYLTQKILHQSRRQIIGPGSLIEAVVKRNPGRETDQFPLIVTYCLNRA